MKIESFFVFLGWMLLDLIGLLTMIKPINKLRDGDKINNFKAILTKNHSLIVLGIEIIGILLLIFALFIPWVYHQFIDINNGIFIRYFYMAEVIVSEHLFYFFVYYPFLLAIIILFLRISINPKIRPFTSLELIELLILIPGIILPFNIKLGMCYSVIPEVICRDSGYSSGLYIYIIGITILAINAIQLSIYSRLVRNKKNKLIYMN